MTFERWIALIGLMAGVIVTVTTWAFATGRYVGNRDRKDTGDRRRRQDVELASFRAECEKRFEAANHELSKAMSYVQGIESRFLREFAHRELVDTRFSDMSRERDRLDREVKELRDTLTHYLHHRD